VERFFLEGLALAYEDSLPRSASSADGGAAPVVAFLNGIAMTIGHWKPLLPFFADRYRCLCHDMRGQMLSDRPQGPYSLEIHADDFAALLESRGIASAHVVGTSYGAEVALAFALKYPARCLSLVLVDGVSETDPLLCATVESWKRAALVDPLAFYRAIVPWNYSATYIGLAGELLAKREAAVASLPRDYFTAFVSLCDAFLEIDMTPRLGEIGCPTLVMVGEKDILKHSGFATIMAKGIRDSRLLVIPKAGHAAVMEDPAWVAREAREFVDSAESRSPGAASPETVSGAIRS
jgi:3-oxoadipate enol-lactonase